MRDPAFRRQGTDGPGRHTVEITISGEKSEGSAGFDFELDAVLTAGDVPPAKVSVTKPYFRWLFGGFGFQHPEANFEALMTDERRDLADVRPRLHELRGTVEGARKHIPG